MSGFKVDLEYQGYVFVGGQQGMFEARDGKRVPFFNMSVLSPASTYTSEDYRAFGFKAEKKKCLTGEIMEGLNLGDKVKLFFDDKGRVISAALDGDSAGGK